MAETHSNLNQLMTMKSRLELAEREDILADNLNTFRNLILEEHDLRCPLDDDFLIRFLRAREFHIELSLKLLKQYYEMRRKNTDVFKDLYPGALSSIFKKRFQIVLENRDSHGRQIFLFRAGDWDPATVNLDQVFRSNYLILEEMISCPETQKNGIVAIVDFNGFGFHHARSFMLSAKHAQRMVQIIQGTFPARFKEFHLVNQPFVFKMIFSIVRPILSNKIRNRIHFHGCNIDSLHKFFSPEILPVSLGGTIDQPYGLDVFTKNMMGKDEYYKEMLQYGYTTGKNSDI